MNLDPELIEELKRLDALMNAPKPVPEYRFYYDETDVSLCVQKFLPIQRAISI